MNNNNSSNGNRTSTAKNAKTSTKRKGYGELMREALANVPKLLSGKKSEKLGPSSSGRYRIAVNASSSSRRYRTPMGTTLDAYINDFLAREDAYEARQARAHENRKVVNDLFGQHTIDFGNAEDGDESTGDMSNMHMVYANPDFGPKYKPVAKAA